MFCKKCGSQISDGAKFCPYCGWKKSQDESGKKLLFILPIIAVIMVALLFLLFGKKKSNVLYRNTGNNYNYSNQESNAGGNVDKYKTQDALSLKIKNAKMLSSYGIGATINQMDTVSMGSYFKDDNNVENLQGIEWIVLDRKDNKALLLSKYIIDCRCYHEQYANVTWEECDLRKWLNNDFYYGAFNENEREKIQTTNVINNDNIDTKISGGNNTSDKIFCLSIEEVRQYFGNGEKTSHGYQLGTNVATSATRYAKDVINSGQHLWVFDYATNTDSDKSERRWADGNSSFWLRSPGNYQKAAALVDYASYLDTKGYGGDNHLTGVRPAMWVSY